MKMSQRTILAVVLSALMFPAWTGVIVFTFLDAAAMPWWETAGKVAVATLMLLLVVRLSWRLAKAT